MRSSCALGGLLFAILLVPIVFLPACSGPWLQVHYVPENGYEQTRNYQFQAQVHADSLGQCKMMVISVKALSKLYSRGEPPPRLQLFDDDCKSPLRFERVQYMSSRTGEHVRLAGSEVVHFLNDNVLLESELIEWLWHEGVI